MDYLFIQTIPEQTSSTSFFSIWIYKLPMLDYKFDLASIKLKPVDVRPFYNGARAEKILHGHEKSK